MNRTTNKIREQETTPESNYKLVHCCALTDGVAWAGRLSASYPASCFFLWLKSFQLFFVAAQGLYYVCLRIWRYSLLYNTFLLAWGGAFLQCAFPTNRFLLSNQIVLLYTSVPMRWRAVEAKTTISMWWASVSVQHSHFPYSIVCMFREEGHTSTT